MPDIVTFDTSGPLRIIEISAGGDNEIDWLEIYSEWKVWSQLSDNLKYPPAFRVVGGDPISDVQNLGSTFFLLAPWRFRPAELDHELIINGNVFYDPPGIPPVVPTLGGYTVLTTLKVSNLVDSAATPEVDPAAIADAVWDEPVADHLGVGSTGAALESGGAGGAGLTDAQATQLAEVWRLLGLDSAAPLTIARTQRSAGSGIVLRIAELPSGSATVTRQ